MTVIIPANRQGPGALIGSNWVVMQAWPVADRWTMALLGPNGGRITQGYGSWDEIPVPRDRPITEWPGRRLYGMDVDLLYDGWLQHPIRPEPPRAFVGAPSLPAGGQVRFARFQGNWIEGQVSSLEALATRQDDPTPPSVRIYGSVPHTEVRWVIQDLSWGDFIRDRITGRLMRQQVTVSLLEYNQPSEISRLPRARTQARTSAYEW
jgi:hypothetical protein